MLEAERNAYDGDAAEDAEGDVEESYFQSAPMQAKLRTLCVGIRKAFDLEEKPEVYRWEQYLHEPLDPT